MWISCLKYENLLLSFPFDVFNYTRGLRNSCFILSPPPLSDAVFADTLLKYPIFNLQEVNEKRQSSSVFFENFSI